VGDLVFYKRGNFDLRADLSNERRSYSRQINSVNVVGPAGVTDELGHPIANARVTVYQWAANKFIVWKGQSYSTLNPLQTDKQGKFSFVLPKGTYYLTIDADGYDSVTSLITDVPDQSNVTANVALLPTQSLTSRLFNWITGGPSADNFALDIKPLTKESLFQPLEKMYDFGMTMEDGRRTTFLNQLAADRPTIVALLGPWNTEVQEQIDIYTQVVNHYGDSVKFITLSSMVPSESIERYIKRGAYGISVNIPDKSFFSAWRVTSLPSIYILNKSGRLERLIIGSNSASELIYQIDNTIEAMQ